MGGNGPLVICEDADLDAAVDATLTACFLNAGQSCTAGERILVHEDVKDDYVARLSNAIEERIRLGDPFDDTTTMGPVNNEPTADKTERHVTEAQERGATLVAGGHRAPAARERRCSSKPPCWTASPTRWRSPARRRSAPSSR